MRLRRVGPSFVVLADSILEPVSEPLEISFSSGRPVISSRGEYLSALTILVDVLRAKLKQPCH